MEPAINNMTRVKKMRLVTGCRDGINTTECRYGWFALQTDRRHWHVQLEHQGGGIPHCFHGRCRNDAGRRHSPIDCNHYWCAVAAVEAVIADELRDEPRMAERAVLMLKQLHDHYLGLRHVPWRQRCSQMSLRLRN